MCTAHSGKYTLIMVPCSHYRVRSNIRAEKAAFCFSDNSLALVHVPDTAAAAAAAAGREIGGWDCFIAVSMGDCTGVGASTDTLLMLRGEFEGFLLCGAGNVYDACASTVECCVLRENTTKKYYIYEWLADLKWTHNVVNILSCDNNSMLCGHIWMYLKG